MLNNILQRCQLFRELETENNTKLSLNEIVISIKPKHFFSTTMQRKVEIFPLKKSTKEIYA
jgi:hypothetical protein